MLNATEKPFLIDEIKCGLGTWEALACELGYEVQASLSYYLCWAFSSIQATIMKG